jgi:transcriptional regulator with XRE-family HTH domain
MRPAAIRNALDFSQEKMAHLLGVSFATVNRWEGGSSRPTGTVLEVYRALAVAINNGLTTKQILGDDSHRGRTLYRIFKNAYGSTTSRGGRTHGR